MNRVQIVDAANKTVAQKLLNDAYTEGYELVTMAPYLWHSRPLGKSPGSFHETEAVGWTLVLVKNERPLRK